MVFSSVGQKSSDGGFTEETKVSLSRLATSCLGAWRIVSSAFSAAGNDGPCGVGANISIYFGVKIKTIAIKKNASKVFLSIVI